MEGAHENGHVHRDISDGNIILVREEKGGRRYGYLVDWEYGSRICAVCLRMARDYLKTVSLGCALCRAAFVP